MHIQRKSQMEWLIDLILIIIFYKKARLRDATWNQIKEESNLEIQLETKLQNYGMDVSIF